MIQIFRKTFVFVAGYFILMTPTYILPWLGSNSVVFNVAGAAVGHGMTPQWWVHAWCLVMVILMAWLRGDFIGKKYLPAFPILAAVFDMTPGLSFIPFIPTAFHLTTIIAGLKVSDQQSNIDGVTQHRKVVVLAGLMSIAAIFGSVLFISTTKESFSDFAEQKGDIAEKINPPLTVVAPTPTEFVVAPPADPEKLDISSSHIVDSEKHSASNLVKRKYVQKKARNSDQNTNNDVGEIRYININE